MQPKPPSRERGPASEESTQTDFSSLDVLGSTPVPSTSIDACLWDGFHLNNGVKITNGAGVLLVNGESFAWRPWNANRGEGEDKRRLITEKGLWEAGDESWGVLALVWPKPGELGLVLFGRAWI
jgi:NADH dehydrogenase [ubiquinone] 1 alpha subcomplex assembly factor 3